MEKDSWGNSPKKGAGTINKIMREAPFPLTEDEIDKKMKGSGLPVRGAIYEHLRSLKLKNLVKQIGPRWVRADWKPIKLRRSRTGKRSGVSPSAKSEVSPADLGDIEGTATETRYTRKKRSRRIRDAAIRESRGICSVCDRDFTKILNGRGVRVLQAHHRKQLSDQQLPALIVISDLAVVCANCHLLLHLDRRKARTVEELRRMLRIDGC
jgi:hypothetical protein